MKKISFLCLAMLFSTIIINAATTEVRDKNQYDQIIEDNQYIVIKFFAPWCPACKTVAPIFKKLSDEFQHIAFLEIDTDNEALSDIVKEHNVRMIPKFSYIKNKELIESKNLSPRQNPKKELSDDLKKHFS